MATSRGSPTTSRTLPSSVTDSSALLHRTQASRERSSGICASGENSLPSSTIKTLASSVAFIFISRETLLKARAAAARRFSVRVPVLSVQMTVVAPRVSTAARSLTRALRFAMRHTPLAMAMVATIGSPSGIEATARAMPVSIIRKISRPPAMPIAPTSAATPRLTHISQRPSSLSLFSMGVVSSTISWTREEIVPSSVLMPVPVTTASPDPLVKAVPLKSMLARSARGTSSGRISDDFATGRDSPVSDDSSACSFEPARIRRSAVMMSPPSRMMISPGTRSWAGISMTIPLRRTLELTAPSLRSASIERFPLSSVTKPMAAFIKITATMANPSTKSPRTKERRPAATKK